MLIINYEKLVYQIKSLKEVFLSKIPYIFVVLNVILLVVVIFSSNKPVHGEASVKEKPSIKEIKRSDKSYKQEYDYKIPFTKSTIKELDSLIDNGSVLVMDEHDRVLLGYNSKAKMMPASTLKVITSLAALKYLGADFRFKTVFKIDEEGNLYIKGYGDPTITSHEMEYIVKHLKAWKGVRELNNIYVDGSYFPGYIMVKGNENTYESYDAKNGALVVNYNTIPIKHVGRRGRKIVSGEKETPYVDYVKTIYEKALSEDEKFKRTKELRIAIKEDIDSLLYFGHLFKQFCKEVGIRVKGGVNVGEIKEGLDELYVYKSLNTLKTVIRDLLMYSNNYTANQILIMLGVVVYGGEPTLEKGVKVLNEYVREDLRLDEIVIKEGSGISYGNAVTAEGMIKVLEYFRPYMDLLKDLGDGARGKSGSLKTVSSYVGYIDSDEYGELRFVILLNQSTGNKDKILDILKRELVY